MENIIVLGGDGMLGHKMFQVLRSHFNGVKCSIRGRLTQAHIDSGIFTNECVIECADAMDFCDFEDMIRHKQPSVIVNCIGVIKQRPIASNLIPSITINALFPHVVAETAKSIGAKLIHFSTDCVFSGNTGNYTEDSPSDATDLYGRTKYIGEINDNHALTLRTSIIGRELFPRGSLLEWFLSKEGKKVSGYTNVWYSGVTTNYLANLVAVVTESHRHLSGLYQVAGRVICKYDLLCLIKDYYGLSTDIKPDDSVSCNRTMNGQKFTKATGLHPPKWADLITQLVNDETAYERIGSI